MSTLSTVSFKEKTQKSTLVECPASRLMYTYGSQSQRKCARMTDWLTSDISESSK